MTDNERLKAMRRLYYYKHRAIDRGDTGRANAIENELDSLRIEKKHSPAYRRLIRKHRLRTQRRDYIHQRDSGYFKYYRRYYRRTHRKKLHDMYRRWYLNIKRSPTRYKRYLASKRKEARRLRSRKKAVKDV